jgi:hypothetical protein
MTPLAEPLSLAGAFGVNVLAIVVLAYAVYYRRYYRRDLVLAYVALNVGVFAVTAVLQLTEAGVGLGLGLFGVLSIIRLRSDTITHEEVAYYFVALALGLVNGLQALPVSGSAALSAMIVAVVALIDRRELIDRSQRHTLTLDRAYTDADLLRATLAELLGGDVRRVVVRDIDLVRDTTIVDVRYRCERPAKTAAPAKSDLPTMTEVGT